MNDQPGWNPEVGDELIRVGKSMGANTGHMFGHPALYAGRRLAACAYEEGVGIKLPADRVRMLLAAGRATPFQPYGKAPMSQWVYLPARTGAEVDQLFDLLGESLAYVAGGQTL